MKKPLLTILLAVILLFGPAALAEEVILPDPGYYFGRTFDGCSIEFDEYPMEECNAYATLLINEYGMEITDTYSGKNDEFIFMEMPGIADSAVYVSCHHNSEGYRMDFYFDNSITLSALDVYRLQADNTVSEIAWDDGLMIVAPGDFLGYEVSLIDIEDFTFQDPPHMNYQYDETPIEDIIRYAEAIDASPYFELVETSEEYVLKYHYRYTGSNPSVTPSDRNLTISISYPEYDASTFYIFEYPGFTINSTANSDSNSNSDSVLCSFCNGDGKCNECGGDNWVWADEWVYVGGSPTLETVNKICDGIYCTGGSCSKCGGDGRISD